MPRARASGFARLGRCYVVLGNHDFADSRDPFSQRVDPEAIAALEDVTLLGRRGRRRSSCAGGASRSSASTRSRTRLEAQLRTTLADHATPTCGSCSATSRGSSSASRGVFHLVLAGHLHAGQIVVPYPGGQAAARAPPRTRRRGPLRLRRDDAARLARPRHDVRPVPVLRAAGGHGAGCTIGVMEAPVISPDVLASYAGDAALEVDGRARASTARTPPRSRAPRTTADVVVHRRARVGGERGCGRRVRCRSASPSTSGAWRISTSRPSTSSSSASARRPRSNDVAPRRPHRRDARDGAGGLPDVRLVADARQPRAGEAQVDRAGRGRVGGVGDGLPRRRRPRARLDAVRARRRSSRVPPSFRPARRRTTPCSSRAPTCSTETQPWVEQSLFLAAIGEARDKGARALEAFAYRYREGSRRPSASSSTEPSSRATSSPTSAFGRCARPGASSWLGSTSAACSPSRKGTREKVLRVVQEAFQPAPAPAPPGGG